MTPSLPSLQNLVWPKPTSDPHFPFCMQIEIQNRPVCCRRASSTAINRTLLIVTTLEISRVERRHNTPKPNMSVCLLHLFEQFCRSPGHAPLALLSSDLRDSDSRGNPSRSVFHFNVQGVFSSGSEKHKQSVTG